MAAHTTPISTYGVQLMSSSTASGTYTKLVDIKSFPDIGGTPETLETTTTSDPMTRYILGIQQLDALTFEANYIKSDYTKLKNMEGTLSHFAVYFGDGQTSGSFSGEDGQYYFSGYLGVSISGGGVNEVVGMSITIAPTTDISATKPTSAG